jgi:hypothetical protein
VDRHGDLVVERRLNVVHSDLNALRPERAAHARAAQNRRKR